MATWLVNTFSPNMIGKGCTAWLREVTFEEAKERSKEALSGISHEEVAKALSCLLGKGIRYTRPNLELNNGDILICITLNFKAPKNHSFTQEEIHASGFRCFIIDILKV